MRQEEPGGGEPSGREPESPGRNRRTDRRQEERTADTKSEKFQKAQEKADRAGEKLHTAREKLDKAQARQAAKKPPGLARKAVRGARAEAWFYVHNKIHQVEQENVGVEGAHKSELAAEGAARRLTRKTALPGTSGPPGGKVGTQRKERPGQSGFSEDGRRTPGACQQPPFPDTTEMETETEVCQRGQSGGKAERKDGKKSGFCHGQRSEAGRAVCGPAPGGRPAPSAVVCGVCRVRFGKLTLYHDWRRDQQRRVRHLLRLRGRRPVRGGRGLFRYGMGAFPDRCEYRERPPRL